MRKVVRYRPGLWSLGLALLALRAAATPLGDGPYAELDWHSLQAPPEAERSVDTLAAYLVEPCSNDREKTRAIFRWVTDRISYDTVAFFSGAPRDCSVGGVLSSRCSVCSGYARLFAALGQAAGLEVAIIPGWAKGFGYRPGDPLAERANHDWNAVKLEGRWQLLDPTWGAGHVNSTGQFVRKFNDFHFLTPPERMIRSYFPEDPKWQLLDPPISREEFTGYAVVESGFWKLGLDFASHRAAVINAGSEVTVTLQGPGNVVMMGRLLAGQQALDDRYVFTQYDGSQHEARVKLPRAGRYTLRLYAKEGGNPQAAYTSVLEYTVVAAEGAGERALFPRSYGTFHEYAGYLFGPLSGQLQAGSRQSFRLRVPGVERVQVVSGQKRTVLSRQGDVFSGEAIVSGDQLGVYATAGGQDTAWALLQYDVN